MAYFDNTGLIYDVINAITQNITGSVFFTFFLIILGALLVCAVLRIKLEFSALLVFPLLVYMSAYESSMFSVLGLAVIYLGFLIAKNFFFWR